MPMLDHLVLRCADIETTRDFYELVGISFEREQHGDGPGHYAGALGGTTLELYPASARRPPEHGLRLGIEVPDLELVVVRLWSAGLCSRSDRGPNITDPDGRVVALREQDRHEETVVAPRGRIGQGAPFDGSGLVGQTVTAIVAARESDDRFLMVWLRIAGSPWWQRFFADAGLVFWEEWEFEQSFDGFDDVPLSDLTRHLHPGGGQVTSAWSDAQQGFLRIATATGAVTISSTDDYLVALVDDNGG